MAASEMHKLFAGIALLIVTAGPSVGCRTLMAPSDGLAVPVAEEAFVPRELDKVSLPSYVIEPPDVLLIDAVKVVPKSPYQIEPLDILFIQAPPSVTPLEAPIAGNYPVEPGGRVNLGPSYGSVAVAGLTLAEATQAIIEHLRRFVRDPEISVQLAESAGRQQIAGEHLVGPDGAVNLGTYGSVYVSGMTLDEARLAIERHLSRFLEQPQVSVDVFAYNSKVYYIVAEGAGQGDQVLRFPVTGNETVLDAVANINGLSQVASKNIWIARPAPGGVGCDQILPVHWNAIVRGASTETNYQILPGDRILIAEDKLIALDSFVNKILSPFERALGFTLLGTQTLQTINRFPEGIRSGGFF